MSQPFVFVSKHRVKDGAIADLEERSTAFARFVADREPWTIGFRLFLSADGSELTHVQVQPDAERMDLHMQLARDHIGAALELAETTSIEVYGQPGPVLGQVLRMNEEAGVPVTIHVRQLNGVAHPAPDGRADGT